jgi:hypothetical protein
MTHILFVQVLPSLPSRYLHADGPGHLANHLLLQFHPI